MKRRAGVHNKQGKDSFWSAAHSVVVIVTTYLLEKENSYRDSGNRNHKLLWFGNHSSIYRFPQKERDEISQCFYYCPFTFGGSSLLHNLCKQFIVCEDNHRIV